MIYVIETFNLTVTFKKNMIQAKDIERCNIWHNLHDVICVVSCPC